MTDVLTNIEQYLHEHLDDSRLQHSRNTAKVAVELARKYGADEHKALVAGLLHDVAKGVCQNGMLNVAGNTMWMPTRWKKRTLNCCTASWVQPWSKPTLASATTILSAIPGTRPRQRVPA